MKTKTTSINWHPSTESPGKKRVVGAFISKKRKEYQIIFQTFRYFNSGVKPCECHSKDRELCVAWADYKDFIKGITPKMIADAKAGAWAWWNREED